MEKKKKPEENFNVGVKMEVEGGLISGSKNTREKVEIDIVSVEGKDFLINALQKKHVASTLCHNVGHPRNEIKYWP